MIIDAHCHVYPDSVAARALATAIPSMVLAGDGTVAGLAAAQDDAGVDRSCCLAVGHLASRVEKANAYVGGLDRQRFIPIGTVHPDLPIEENLRSLREHAVRGVKVHPILQGYRLDDPRLLEIMRALADEYPVIVHVGAGAGSDGEPASPRMLRDIATTIPTLDIVACHFGGYHKMVDALENLVGERVYLDTSWPPSVAELGVDSVAELIDRHGAERVLFSSDWPTASPAADIAFIRRLGLSASDLEAVLGGNAARLFGIAEGVSGLQ